MTTGAILTGEERQPAVAWPGPDGAVPPCTVAILIPSLSHGGAERVASVLANQWCGLPDLRVLVVTFSGLADFHRLDPRVGRINLPLGPRPGPFALARLAWRVRRELRRANVKAALSFMDKYNVFFLGGLAGAGVRVSVTDRSNPLKPLPRWLRMLKRLTYPRAATVIAQTRQAAAEVASRTGAHRVVAIPNPLPAPAAPSGVPRELLVLNVGRLVPEKGQEHLIRAFAAARLPGWRLAILGEGPLRPALEAEAEAAGLRDQIDLPGVVDDVAAWSDRASVFAFSSVSEGFPNALVEAMGRGLPCVSFDCDAGPREIITDGVDGVLAPVRDESALAGALRTLAERPEMRTRLGQAASARVKAFDERTISLDYLRACLGPIPSSEGERSCASS